MFIVVSLVVDRAGAAVAFAGSVGSYPLLLVFGFFLGIAGTIFAVGIPFANAWYEAARRGFATGVFGDGHGRHRAVGVLHTPVRALVRPVRHPRHHRGRRWR